MRRQTAIKIGTHAAVIAVIMPVLKPLSVGTSWAFLMYFSVFMAEGVTQLPLMANLL